MTCIIPSTLFVPTAYCCAAVGSSSFPRPGRRTPWLTPHHPPAACIPRGFRYKQDCWRGTVQSGTRGPGSHEGCGWERSVLQGFCSSSPVSAGHEREEEKAGCPGGKPLHVLNLFGGGLKKTSTGPNLTSVIYGLNG